jgi:hypothetical protein
MPFTVSHAAVVLPFARLLARRRLLSAVVVGSMVPDFGLFFPWRIYRFETHSALALITFCLPIGLATYWIFQYSIKTPVMEVLPEGAHARWHAYASPADFASMRQWVLAACGILAGAVTHLIWDAFTHENARGIRMIPWLEEPVVEIGKHHVAVAHLMQDVSSLIGLIVVLAIVWYGLRRGHETAVPGRPLRPAERWAWVAIYGLGAIALCIAWLLWARLAEPPGHSVNNAVTLIAVAALRGAATSLVCVSLALDWRLRALHRRSAHTPPS